MVKYEVIVVGEGAAGLMAAGQAAQNGAGTLLLAKMDSPGCKLSLTGNGRCNMSNTAELSEFIKRFGPNGRFLRQAFSRFFTDELVAFFKELGVETVTEDKGCIFTASGRAEDVVDALVRWNQRSGVEMRMASAVKSLIVEQGKVTAVRTKTDTIYADSVIIATGGASYPGTGSSGDGYQLAESVGHAIVPIRPSLVPLETAGSTAAKLQGVSLSDVVVRVWVGDKKQIQTRGDILFTHFGLSGPAILSLSRHIVDWLYTANKVFVSIDLQPRLDERQLDEKLVEQLRSQGKRKFKSLMGEFLPGKLTDVFAELTGIDDQKIGNQVTAEQRRKLRRWLKDFRLEVKGHRPLEEAIVTAGGVDIREIDPRTMASKIIKGLYFAGEVLDIDGDTGGFNLQAAFSTGWLAGKSAGWSRNN